MATKVKYNKKTEYKFHAGDIIIIVDETGDEIPLMICQVGSCDYCFMGLDDGNRYDEPVRCENHDLTILLKANSYHIIEHYPNNKFYLEIKSE